MIMPKVSVILSSYNHEKYISDSIKSVLNQTFTDFELLIFDDGSTDNSQDIIRAFDDARIKLFLYEKNRGSYFALQEPLKLTIGKYVAFHHSDDIWEPTKLEKQVQFLEKNPQYEVCFTQAKFIDEKGEIYDLPENHPYKNVFKQNNRTRAEWLNHLFWNLNCFCNPTMLIRNVKKNFVMTPLLFQLPDYFMWINLCLKKNPYVLQEELIKFRLRRNFQNSVSSLTEEKFVRNANELYVTAREFLPLLRDEKFFLQVFPEAEEFLIDGKISSEFAFAQLCLKKNLPSYQKLALEILYDLLCNGKKRSLIKKLYNYDEKDFIRDTGKIDVFGVKSQLEILNCRLYIDFGGGFNENDSVASKTLILPDKSFTATFDFLTVKNISGLRFDPDEKAALSIKIFKITVNGEMVENFTSNALQVVDGYFNFLTADPFFTITEKFSAGKIHVEILGAVNNDALLNFEKKYSDTCATVQDKISQVQQLENSLQEKSSHIQQLENFLQDKSSHIQQLESSLQDKSSQIQQLESSLQDKSSHIQQLENSLQDKISQIQQLENSLQDKSSHIQQLENSLQDKSSHIQQLENSLQEKSSHIQQLENSLQEKSSHIQQLENSLQDKISQIQQLQNILQEKEFTIQQQQCKIQQQESTIFSKNEDLQSKKAEIDNLQNIQNEILNSNSWKVTKPLRAVGRMLRKI